MSAPGATRHVWWVACTGGKPLSADVIGDGGRYALAGALDVVEVFAGELVDAPDELELAGDELAEESVVDPDESDDDPDDPPVPDELSVDVVAVDDDLDDPPRLSVL